MLGVSPASLRPDRLRGGGERVGVARHAAQPYLSVTRAGAASATSLASVTQVAGCRVVDDSDTAHGGVLLVRIRPDTADASFVAQRSISAEAIRGQAGGRRMFRLAGYTG
jgi:hypothetical protein